MSIDARVEGWCFGLWAERRVAVMGGHFEWQGSSWASGSV